MTQITRSMIQLGSEPLPALSLAQEVKIVLDVAGPTLKASINGGPYLAFSFGGPLAEPWVDDGFGNVKLVNLANNVAVGTATAAVGSRFSVLTGFLCDNVNGSPECPSQGAAAGSLSSTMSWFGVTSVGTRRMFARLTTEVATDVNVLTFHNTIGNIIFGVGSLIGGGGAENLIWAPFGKALLGARPGGGATAGADSGNLRVARTFALNARNAADTADYRVLASDAAAATPFWALGAPTAETTDGFLDVLSQIHFRTGAVDRLLLGGSNFDVNVGISLHGFEVRSGHDITLAMSPYNVLPTEEQLRVQTVAAGGPITILLPAVAGSNDRELEIYDFTSNAALGNVTITPAAGDTIDGTLLGYTINTAFGGVRLIADPTSNTNWVILVKKV